MSRSTMSIKLRRGLAFAGAQLILAGVFASLYWSPAVALQSWRDDTAAIVMRWRPASVPAGSAIPQVVPFRQGYGLKGAKAARSELQLDDTRLATLDTAAPYTVTAEAELSKVPKERAVVVSQAGVLGLGFEMGVNRRRQPYVAVGGARRQSAILTGEGKLLPKRVMHLAAVVEPARRIALFVDGALVIELRGKEVPSPTAALPWIAGNRSGRKHAFSGTVGTLRFFRRALSAAEVAAEVTASGLTLRTAGLPAQRLTTLRKPKKKSKSPKFKPGKSKLRLPRRKKNEAAASSEPSSGPPP